MTEESNAPVPSSERPEMWNMLCHLTSLLMFFGIPLGNIVGPLVIWLWKKDEVPSVVEHGKESLNFQISMTIYGIVAFLLCFVLIGFLILLVLFIFEIVMIVKAAMAANKGELTHYPITIRFLK